MLNSYSIKTRKSYFPSHSMTNEWKNALICVIQHFYVLHKIKFEGKNLHFWVCNVHQNRTTLCFGLVFFRLHERMYCFANERVRNAWLVWIRHAKIINNWKERHVHATFTCADVVKFTIPARHLHCIYITLFSVSVHIFPRGIIETRFIWQATFVKMS